MRGSSSVVAQSRHKGKKKKKKTCVRGADATDFAFTTLRLSLTCLLRLYFRSVVLSISVQCLSSGILLVIAMFTFCFSLARNHQAGLIWAHTRRGYFSGFSCIPVALWFSHGVSRSLVQTICAVRSHVAQSVTIIRAGSTRGTLCLLSRSLLSTLANHPPYSSPFSTASPLFLLTLS